jgi:hypothetical protein
LDITSIQRPFFKHKRRYQATRYVRANGRGWFGACL